MNDMRIYEDTKAAPFGFTLIELLIVVSIMVVIIGVIGACLSGGIRVWDSARIFNDLESDAFIAMDIMEKDIMNSLSVYSIGFDGKQSSVSFPSYITTDNRRSIGSVTYEFNAASHAVLRIERSWQQHDLRRERLLGNVKVLDFTYYQLSTSVWQNVNGPITNFPDKVGVTLLLSNGEREITIERQILLPVRDRNDWKNSE